MLFYSHRIQIVRDRNGGQLFILFPSWVWYHS